MKRLIGLIATALILLLGYCGAALANDVLRELHRQAFAKWDGVLAYCSISPEDSSNSELCEWVLQKVRLAGLATSVRVVVGPRHVAERFMLMRSHKDQMFLDLEIDIQGVGSSNRALTGALTAQKYYFDAIESKGVVSQRAQSPRPGTLVLWSRRFVAAGSVGADFEMMIRQTFETNVNAFFSDFAEARRPN